MMPYFGCSCKEERNIGNITLPVNKLLSYNSIWQKNQYCKCEGAFQIVF